MAVNAVSESRKPRRPLSQRIRFEVFKRDSFTCRYCGARAPDVVLHVDHVIPVAGGGSNSPANLVTSCASCNSGKGARSLSQGIIVAFTKEKALEAKEHAAQIRMIAKAHHEEESAFEELGQVCWDRWLTYGVYVGRNDEAAVRNLPKHYPLQAIFDGMDWVVKRNHRRHEPCMRFLQSSVRMFMEPQEKMEARKVRRALEGRFPVSLDNDWIEPIQRLIESIGSDKTWQLARSAADIDAFEIEMDRMTEGVFFHA